MNEIPEEKKKKSPSELRQRLITGSLLSALTLYLVWSGVYPFASLCVFFALIGQYEFNQFSVKKGYCPSLVMGGSLTFVLMVSSIYAPVALVNQLLLFGLIAVFSLLILRPEARVSSLIDTSLTAFGVIYVGWFFTFLIHLRKLPQGAALVTLLLFSCAFTDMGGFFVGRRLGKTKLHPRVSPNKTVEGALGGVVTAVVASLGVGLVVKLPLAPCAVAAVIIAIAGQFGDLFESSLKRDVGVKDSGKAIPGHGGALDRFDSLAFAAPIFYLYAVHFML